MQQYRDLNINLSAENTGQFIAALDAALANGWKRAHEQEREARRDSIGGECYYYICDRRESREPALLAIYRRDTLGLYVSNVVPQEITNLSYEQYNQILQDFHDSVLLKVNTTFPVSVILGSEHLSIEHLISANALTRLCLFSNLASKSTGSAHPLDQERWIAFLVALSREKHTLDAHSLGRWLTDVEQWSSEMVHELTCEFEFAIALLSHERATRIE